MRKLVRLKQFSLSRNHYFIVGILLGLILTLMIPDDAWTITEDECPDTTESSHQQHDGGDIPIHQFEPHINLVNKPMAAKKVVKNIVRPRYYSSELGIREKLFVAVITSQKNIDTLATSFNRTVAHLVNKIKFFINADNVIKSNFVLKNIVGFTDTRENLRPYHILKYIADNYLNDFDYFLLITDENYVDARRLMEKLYHISISFDVYMGRPIEPNELHSDDQISLSDRDYCDLNSGIILSSSVIRKIRTNLDWCVRNAVTSFHSLNIGKCVKYSSKITGCQQSFQGINLTSFKLNTYKVHRDMSILKHNKQFKEAIFLHPIISVDDFYILHIYFSRLQLKMIKSQQIELDETAKTISNGTISNDILEIRWPLGVPESKRPEIRHDIIPWTFLNETHQLMPDYELNSKLLSKVDADDMRKIMNRTQIYAHKMYPHLTYFNLHSAYRRFDPIRGLDYKLHMNFRHKTSNDLMLKSFHIVKPLGRVEIIPSPYVTESTRISMVLPVFVHQIELAQDFIERYRQICMAPRDNTFLMLVFLYRSNTPNKGGDDVFLPLKKLALELSDKYKDDGSRIAWLSIRLPDIFSSETNTSDVVLSSMYAEQEILSFAVADLALLKIALDGLVMICSIGMTFKADFLNRVRMNTVRGFQVFSPIGFMMYPCNFGKFCKDCDSCDVSQNAGYFDKINRDVIAFYIHDYVEARKSIQSQVPIIFNDNDIEKLAIRTDQTITAILDVFIKGTQKESVHILRAIEPNLRFGTIIRNYVKKSNDIPVCRYWNTEKADKCIHIASRKNIGDMLVRYDIKMNAAAATNQKSKT